MFKDFIWNVSFFPWFLMIYSDWNFAFADINNFELNTDQRAERRHEWETYKKVKEVELSAAQASRDRQIEEEEKQEIARKRREVVHKPEPIRKYRPVEVKSSDKPLTDPQTPRFSERLKTRIFKA